MTTCDILIIRFQFNFILISNEHKLIIPKAKVIKFVKETTKKADQADLYAIDWCSVIQLEHLFQLVLLS